MRKLVLLQSEREREDARAWVRADPEGQPSRPVDLSGGGRIAGRPCAEGLDQQGEFVLGDLLPATDLGGNVKLPQTAIDLSFMELGDGPHGESWLARMLALRDAPDLGPFRLAFLEAMLRVADWRASGEPSADAVEEEKK